MKDAIKSCLELILKIKRQWNVTWFCNLFVRAALIMILWWHGWLLQKESNNNLNRNQWDETHFLLKTLEPKKEKTYRQQTRGHSLQKFKFDVLNKIVNHESHSWQVIVTNGVIQDEFLGRPMKNEKHEVHDIRESVKRYTLRTHNFFGISARGLREFNTW